MSLQEDLRSGIDQADDAIKEWGGKVTEGTKELYGRARDRIHTYNEVQRTESGIGEQKRRIRQAYTRIGQAYYEAHREDDVVDPAFAEEFAKVAEAASSLHELEETLHSLKGARVCINCGHEVSEEDVFCPKCGNRL